MVDHSIRKLEDILATYRDGDEGGWDNEFQWLLDNHAEKIADLLRDVRENGFKHPIILGTDGRVWDGHHRLLVARILNVKDIPCIRADLS